MQSGLVPVALVSMVVMKVCAISESGNEASKYFMDMEPVWNHDAVTHCWELNLSTRSLN